MDTSVIEKCVSLSLKGEITFPEVVKKLKEVGVTAYYADLIRLQKTYYSQNDESHIESLKFNPPKIAEEFFAEGVKSAIRSIQKQEIDYPEFLRQIMGSGTVSYTVFINGKKAIYFGRNGDFHIENFPPSK